MISRFGEQLRLIEKYLMVSVEYSKCFSFCDQLYEGNFRGKISQW